VARNDEGGLTVSKWGTGKASPTRRDADGDFDGTPKSVANGLSNMSRTAQNTTEKDRKPVKHKVAKE
jgi:hypothetical protein